MRESCKYGSARGARGNSRPYRNRREFIGIVGGIVAACALDAEAQTQEKVWRIGIVWLASRPTGPHAQVFEQRLVDLGYAPGRNVMLSFRFTEPTKVEETLRALLPQVDILVIWTTFGSVTAKKLAGSMPVVFLGVGAPVEIGLVEGLAHPGGNMTGVTFEAGSQTYARRLQILTEIVPNLNRVALLQTLGDPNVTFAMRSIELAAPQLGVTLVPIDIKTVNEIDEAFQGMTKNKAQALLVISSAVTAAAHNLIATLSLAHHLPTCGPFRQAVAAGQLVSLGPDTVVMARQGADYVNKIIKGAKPSDLPVEQPTKFDLVINLKTAKALGLTIPQSILLAPTRWSDILILSSWMRGPSEAAGVHCACWWRGGYVAGCCAGAAARARAAHRRPDEPGRE